MKIAPQVVDRKEAAVGQKLKVGLLCDWFLPRLGGIELHMRDLAVHLFQEGHDVQVITPTPGADVEDGIPVHRLNVPLFPKFGFVYTPKAFRRIREILAREKYDVVHVHTSIVAPTAFGGAYICSDLLIPAVVTFHSILNHTGRVLRYLDRWVRWSSWPILFSTVSEAAVQHSRRTFGNTPVYRLPNGIDPDAWRFSSLPHDPKEFWIVTTLRLTRKKRPKALVRMMGEILKRVPAGRRVQFKVIGDGPDRIKLEKMVAESNLGSSVTFLGRRDRSEVKEVYRRADIFVLPSRKESFGIAALEARCAGLPVVAMFEGGVREFITDGREGFLAKDDEEFIDRVGQLIKDDRLRDTMAQLNRETDPPFGWDSVIADHLRHYRLAMALSQTKSSSSR